MTGEARLELYDAIHGYFDVNPVVQIEEAFQEYIRTLSEDSPLRSDAKSILSKIRSSKQEATAAAAKAQSERKTKQAIAAVMAGAGLAAAGAGGVIGLALNHQKQLNSQNATE